LGELNNELEVILPDNNNKSSLINDPFEVETPAYENGYLNVFPNPAKDYIICEYNIKVPFSVAQLVITEASGGKSIFAINLEFEKDQKTIDLSNFINGSYILSLKINQEVINSVKFNVLNN